MPLINIFIVLALVAVNGFFVACEFSLVAVRPTRVQQLKQAGSRRARVVESLLKDLDRVLSGVQLGITMATLALGWLGEITIARFFEPLLVSVGIPWSAAVAHSIAITLAFLLIMSLHVVLGELVPKSMALQRAEKVALGGHSACTAITQPAHRPIYLSETREADARFGSSRWFPGTAKPRTQERIIPRGRSAARGMLMNVARA